MFKRLRARILVLAGVLLAPLLLVLTVAPAATAAPDDPPPALDDALTPEPAFASCPATMTELTSVTGMLRRDKPPHEQRVTLTLAEPAQVTVIGYVKEGHPESCPGGKDCGQGQMYEEIMVLVGDQLLGEHLDQGAEVEAWLPVGPWQSDLLAAGETTLTVAHRMRGTTAESVSYKLTVCAAPEPPPPGDTTPPCVVDLLIDGGGIQTRRSWVDLMAGAIDPEPGSGVAEVRFAEYVYRDGVWTPTEESLSAAWLPYSPATVYRWELAPDPGLRYIQAWARDGAGNISQPDCAQQAAINRLVCASLPLGPLYRSRVFRYPLAQDARVQITLTSTSGDADLYVYPPDYASGRPAWMSYLRSPAVDQLDFVAPVAGEYQIEVFRYSSAASYCLDVAIDGPPFTPGPVPAAAGAANVPLPGPTVPLDLVPDLVWPLVVPERADILVYLPLVRR